MPVLAAAAIVAKASLSGAAICGKAARTVRIISLMTSSNGFAMSVKSFLASATTAFHPWALCLLPVSALLAAGAAISVCAMRAEKGNKQIAQGWKALVAEAKKD